LTAQAIGCRQEALVMVFNQVDTKALSEPIIRFREEFKPLAHLRAQATAPNLIPDLLGWITTDEGTQTIDPVLQ
jgi:hypothetical protein